MATFHDAAVPRKRIATYGKAARRRLPEFSFTSTAQKSQPPESQPQRELQAAFTRVPTTTPQKLKPVRQRSITRTVSPGTPVDGDVYDVPPSDDEAPKSIRKATTPPAKRQKAKAPLRQRSLSRPASSASPPSRDISDPPEDEVVPKPVQKKAVLPLAVEHQRLKPVRPVPMPKASLPVSPAAPNVFDVPSSGDEAEATPKPVHKVRQTVVAKVIPRARAAGQGSTDTGDGLGSRKKMRMSPAPEPMLKRLPVNTIVRPPKVRATSRPANNVQKSPTSNHFTKMVARPKPRTPQKLSPTPQRQLIALSTPSPQLSDMMDVDPKGETISPRGMKLWQGLVDSAEVSDVEMPESPMAANHQREVRPRSRTPARLLSRPAGITKSQKLSPKLPRRRLIDTLVEQATPDEESEEESEEEDSSQSLSDKRALDEIVEMLGGSRSQSVAQEPNNPTATMSESQSSQISGPKRTYSKQRSMLEEKDLMQELALGMPTAPVQTGGRRGRRVSIPSLQPLSSFNEEDDEDSQVAAVRSVHELRKAGANNRFVDEVQDYLERIGKPDPAKISMRRSGLLDLASKMKDKEFAEKFRANGMELKLFMHLGQEQDVVAGYIMVSLLTILVDGGMPHVIAQLRRQGITRLLIRLLEFQSSITSITKDRKSNMSKVAQTLVAEHHEYLLQLPIWEDLQPQVISPRTLALKCIERMVRKIREAGSDSDIFSKELTTNLFGILKAGSAQEWWNLPQNKHAIDFHLALSALESHSITARTVHDESIWISDYLPVIADTIEIASCRPLDTYGEQQALILRLTLNVTNNNAKASDVFARPKLMAILGRIIVERFRQISRFLTEDDFSVVIEHLVLTTGVMINLADRSTAVRESLQALEGDESDPLDGMFQAFLDSQERMSMAESVEETQKNVAFGYLAVSLGYFSLLPEIHKRIQNKPVKKTSRSLLASIQEFIGYNKTVDAMIAADEDGHNPQARLTERLESLVSQMAALQGLGK